MVLSRLCYSWYCSPLKGFTDASWITGMCNVGFWTISKVRAEAAVREEEREKPEEWIIEVNYDGTFYPSTEKLQELEPSRGMLEDKW